MAKEGATEIRPPAKLDLFERPIGETRSYLGRFLDLSKCGFCQKNIPGGERYLVALYSFDFCKKAVDFRWPLKLMEQAEDNVCPTGIGRAANNYVFLVLHTQAKQVPRRQKFQNESMKEADLARGLLYEYADIFLPNLKDCASRLRRIRCNQSEVLGERFSDH